MSYRDKIADKKRASSNPIISVINSVTPGGYAMKRPSFFDFYEGEAPLDWDDISDADPLRVIFQATCGRHGRHGDDKPDREVARFVAQAKENGCKYGLYHLLVPHSITEQCDFYMDTVDKLGGFGDMPAIVDIEYEPPKGRDTFREQGWAGEIQSALDILDAACGAPTVIYWSKKFAAFCNDRNGNPPKFILTHPQWIAGYPWKPFIDGSDILPCSYMVNGAVDWAAWQYSETGRTDGYPANDLSVVSPWFYSQLEEDAA